MDRKLFAQMLKVGFELGWDKVYGKWSVARHQSLLYHALNTALIMDALAEALGLPEPQRRALAVGAFLHDYAKVDQAVQGSLARGERVRRVPKLRRGDREALETLISEKFGLGGEEARLALGVATQSELPSGSEDLVEQLMVPSVGRLPQDLMGIADRLSGIKDLGEVASISRDLEKYGFRLAYHSVSIVRGVSTQLLHTALEEVFVEHGFKPIAYTPRATIYVGRRELDPPKLRAEELAERVFKIFAKRFEEMPTDAKGSAVYGDITKTVVKSPKYLLFRGTVDAFWKHVSTVCHKSKARGQFLRVVEAEFCRERGIGKRDCEAFADKFKAIQIMLIVFKQALMELDGIFGEAGERIAQDFTPSQAGWNLFISWFGLDPNRFRELRVAQLANQTKAGDAFRAVFWVADKLGLIYADKKEAIERLESVFSDIMNRVVGEIKRRDPDILKRVFLPVFTELCTEVSHPALGDPRKLAEEIFNSYSTGKSRGSPICSICGRPAVVLAKSPKIGGGTESFTNFLEAGVPIGGQYKARVCVLCDFEAELRSLFTEIGPDDRAVFYVIPMFLAARGYVEMLWERMKNALEVRGAEEKRNPLRYQEWADEIVSNGVESVKEKAVDVLSNIFSLARERERVLETMEKLLKEGYEGDLENAIEDYEECGEVKSFRELAQCIYESGELPEWIEKKLSSGLALYSGNYLVLVINRRELRGGKESESVELVRRMFIGLLISMLFQSSVYIPDVELAPLFEVAPRGYLRYVSKLTLTEVFERLGLRAGGRVGEWIPINLADGVLLKLAGLIKVNQILRIGKADYGSNSLVELATKPPGMILTRYMSVAPAPLGKKNVGRLLTLIRSLDIVFSRSEVM